MRLSTPLFAIALLAGTVSAAALAPQVASRAPKSRVAKAAPVVARRTVTAPVVAAAPVAHRAHRTHRAPATQPIAAPAPAAAQGGMIISIDPETGQVGMPTPEQMEAFSADPAFDDSDAGLVEVHHPNGTVSVDLQGRFQEYAVIRIAPDGQKVFGCVPTRAQAKQLLTIPANTPVLEVK
jgi:hypothetical protein